MAVWLVQIGVLVPIDLPPSVLQCVAPAASYYQVNAELLLAILMAEGGSVGMASKNANGTYDLGPMQINTVHLDKLTQYGISPQTLKDNGCINIFIGAWRLKSEIVRVNGDVWKGVGNYHSRTPTKNHRYQMRVWGHLSRIYQSGNTQRQMFTLAGR